MGALYLAADTGAFGRKCVVKELLGYYDPTDPEEAREARARFETEGRLLAALSHPGIPRIYSYFTEAGRHYIVMEYIEGETLEEAITHANDLGRIVAARPLSSEEVVRHAVRVCQVLEYLAAQPTPVVHHDIKPANLIVDSVSGEVRLVDFGTAKMQTRWARQQQEQRGQTTLFGTVGYAAPEQFQGESDPKADIYALAATTYHLLTDDDPGDHPFQFPAMETLPGALSDALLAALDPHVSSRSTAAELRQALESWLLPEERGQPFFFRSGVAASTTRELVQLSDRHWDEARSHLSEGDFERWFRGRSRHDLVAQSQAAQQEGNDDTNAALEAFLRRLDPRRPPPRITVEPTELDFGKVKGDRPAVRQLTLRNEGHGYARVQCQASVPWLQPIPAWVGCRAGQDTRVAVRIDAAKLPLRPDHQAVVACTPTRGARVSVPVAARMNVAREVLRRIAGSLWPLLRSTARGTRRGARRWLAAARSLLSSRLGAWIVAVETLVLAGVLVALWETWAGINSSTLGLLWRYVQALPVALAAIYLLPALAYILVAVVEAVLARED
jgi:serine/threonine protein kinase